jgi:hypothetical protein
MEYWFPRLMDHGWIALLLKTHHSTIPLFQYSNPMFFLFGSNYGE